MMDGAKKNKYMPTLKAMMAWVGMIIAGAIGSYAGGKFEHVNWTKSFVKQEVAKRCSEKVVLFRELAELNVRASYLVKRNREIAAGNLIQMGMGMYLTKQGKGGVEGTAKLAREFLPFEGELMDIHAKAAGNAALSSIYFGDDVGRSIMASLIDSLKIIISMRIDGSLSDDVISILSSDIPGDQKPSAISDLFKRVSGGGAVNLYGGALAAMAPEIQRCTRGDPGE